LFGGGVCSQWVALLTPPRPPAGWQRRTNQAEDDCRAPVSARPDGQAAGDHRRMQEDPAGLSLSLSSQHRHCHCHAGPSQLLLPAQLGPARGHQDHLEAGPRPRRPKPRPAPRRPIHQTHPQPATKPAHPTSPSPAALRAPPAPASALSVAAQPFQPATP
ncbi:hypothetical protein PTTG_26733, partial [Puccinia triticina 1-1 BBBD Race 1]